MKARSSASPSPMASVNSLRLAKGDTVTTPKGCFVVLRVRSMSMDVLWLDEDRLGRLWHSDYLYRPVEVLRSQA